MATLAPAVETIRADESLTLAEFKRRTGFSKYSLRRAREQGLPVKRLGNRGFVLGADWLQFLADRPADQR